MIRALNITKIVRRYQWTALNLGDKISDENSNKGASKGEVVRKEEFERMLNEYYKTRVD